MHRLPFRVGSILILLFCLPVFTSACTMKAGLERPNGVAVAADNSLYIMDFGNYRIVKASETGKLLRTTGTLGEAADRIYYGWDIALDAQGNQYIGHVIRDDDGPRHDGVKVFSAKGMFLREIGQMDYDRASEEQPHLPYGVTVDGQGRVYTADIPKD
jgi:sugar lactone lactonase YvrE